MQSYLDPDQNLNDQKSNNQAPAPAPATGYLNAGNNPQQVALQQQQQQQSPQQDGAPDINPTPTGTNTPGQVVTPGMASMTPPPPNPNTPGQQAWAQQVNQMNTNMINKMNGTGSGPQGINPGYLGIAQGEYARGKLAAQQSVNATQAQGIANENQAFNRQEVTKQQQISQGMQKAAQAGGYGAVIDYLNTADPEKSLKIQQQKTDLDKNMLTADSLSMQNDDQKKASLFAGYGLLGKMGATILSAAPADRQALYTQMLPMVKAVNPNAPSDVASATPMFMLGAGQAKLPNQIWSSMKDVDATNSDIGKANADLQTLRSQGVPDTSPQSQALVAKIRSAQLDNIVKQNTVDDLSNKNLLQQQQLTKGNQNQASSKYELISKMSGDYEKQSTNFSKYQSAYTEFMSAQQQLMSNPKDGTAQAQMAALTPKMLGYMRASPQIMASLADTDNGAEKFTKDLTNRFNPGGTQKMSPTEIGRLVNLTTATYQGMSGLQDNVNSAKFTQAKQALVPFQDQKLSPADQQAAAAQQAAGIVHYQTKDPQIPSQQKIDSDLQQYRQSGQYTEQQLQQAKSLVYKKYGYYNLDTPQ